MHSMGGTVWVYVYDREMDLPVLQTCEWERVAAQVRQFPVLYAYICRTDGGYTYALAGVSLLVCVYSHSKRVMEERSEGHLGNRCACLCQLCLNRLRTLFELLPLRMEPSCPTTPLGSTLVT